MNNPLTEEQQKRLAAISRLEPEKQKQALNEFLSTLDKEQIEFLQKQQVKCPFCAIAKKEIKAFIVYEDNQTMGVLDINPANKGHVIIFPLVHAESFSELKSEHIFSVARKINEAILKGLKAKGTNILISNGAVAGQAVPHFAVHIIPRADGDGLKFILNPKKISESEMEETKQLIIMNIEKEEIETGKSDEVYKAIERVP